MMHWNRGLSDLICSIDWCADNFPSFWPSTIEPDEADKLPLDKQAVDYFKVSKLSKDGVDAGAVTSPRSGWFMGEMRWLIPVCLALGVEGCECVTINWAWEEVVEYRQYLAEWAGIRWTREMLSAE